MNRHQRRQADAPPDFGRRYGGRTLRVTFRVATGMTAEALLERVQVAVAGPSKHACFTKWTGEGDLPASLVLESEPNARLLVAEAVVNTPEDVEAFEARLQAWANVAFKVGVMQVDVLDEEEADRVWCALAAIAQLKQNVPVAGSPGNFMVRIPRGKDVP